MCLGVILLQLALSLGVYITYGPWYSALTLVFLTAALTSWYGAFEYRLDDEGVAVHGPLGTVRHQWREFGDWRVVDEDVLLRFAPARRPPELVLHAPGLTGQVERHVAGRLK
ncbi:MAG: hypothetical protein J7M38_05735 [Armatimonadetes bacterium]|nr:hypothetical protein [Armatimonadota bacterium]